MADGEEFLPPLQILTATDCDIVPRALAAALDRKGLEQSVDVGEAALDAGVLTVDVVNLVTQCTCRRNRVSALNHQMGRVKVQTEDIGQLRTDNLAQLVERADVVYQQTRELLDGDLLDTVVLGKPAEFLPPDSSEESGS